METGELGAVGPLVPKLAVEELRLTPDFATIQHLPMEEQHVLDPAQKLYLVTPHLVEQANLYFR
jgi:hypothetical protein